MEYKVSYPNHKVRDFTVLRQISIPNAQDNNKSVNFQKLQKNNGNIVYRFIRANKGTFIPDPCEMSKEELSIFIKLLDD